MKKLLILGFLFLAHYSFSQHIEFLRKNDSIEDPKYRQFIYLTEKTDLANARLIATVKATGELKNVVRLFDKIKSETQKYGANAFKFESFRKLDNATGELILSTFFCEDALFEANVIHIPKNKIFVYGSQDLTENKTQSYKVQGEKYEIGNGQFKVFDVKIGEEIKVSKGGFTGMALWIKRRENEYSTFLSFSGIGMTGIGIGPANVGVGVNITTGRITRIEPNLALALLKIYSEKQ